MKQRIGIGIGGATDWAPADLAALVGDMAELGFDSLWLAEILTAPGPDPLVTLAWAAQLHPKLKLGTTMLLPGRNEVRLAKALATLDVLSGGRLLVTFVPGINRSPERDATGVPMAERGAQIEETIPRLKRWWRGEEVDGITVTPRPAQEPFDVWLGGMAQESLLRCGRVADGWLPSLCSPEEAAAGKRVIDEAAEGAGRTISPEHFGVSIGYAAAPLTDQQVAAFGARSRGNDPRTLVPVGHQQLRATIEAYLEVGFSKFVVRPMAPMGHADDWRRELEALAASVGDLQT
jgi:probable F420-dependent oxidoreductase